MKRHISIFTLLLSAFAAVGPAGRTWGDYQRVYSYTRLGDGLAVASDKTVVDPDWGAADDTPRRRLTFQATLPDGTVSTGWMWTQEFKSQTPTDWKVPDKSKDTHISIADDGLGLDWSFESTTTSYVLFTYRYITYDLDYRSDKGGATLPDDLNDISYDKSLKLVAPSESPTGYHFANWSATSTYDPDFDETFDAGETVGGFEFGLANCREDNETITLKANWTANVYTVSFNANGGDTPEPATKEVTYDSTYGELATCTRTGYTFGGWWTKEDGGTEIEPSTSVRITEDQTLYAHWTENPSYWLTIHPNGGRYDGDPDVQQLGTKLVVGLTNLNSILVATKDDGSPLKVYRDGDGADIYDKNGKAVVGKYWTEKGEFCGKISGDTLHAYAIWGDKPEWVEVVVRADPVSGGKVAGGGQIRKGEDVTLTAVTNMGYSFCCWTNGIGAVVSTDDHYTFTATVAVTNTAVFTGNVYTVTYRTEGGHPENPKRTVTFGSPYGEPPAVAKDGYELVGWFTDYDGEGDRIDPDTPVTIAKNHNLIACWKEKSEFRGTFVDPSGTNKTVVIEGLTKDQPVPADKVPDFKRTGYWFNGWNPALPEKVTGDFTTYAQWMSLASVLDCEGTLWFAIDDNSAWFVDSTDCKQGGTSLRADGPRAGGSGRLTTSVSEPGTMTFWWKGDAGTVLSVKSGTETWSFSGSAGMDWTPCTITITNKEPSSVIFYCAETGGFAGRCSVDCFAWTQGIEPVKYEVTFTDPSKTFTNETYWVEDGGTAVAPDWDRKTDKFESLAWSKPLSPITGIVTNEAVWTCRVEFVDREGGNSPVTNKVGYGQSVVAPTTFTPPEGKHFGGWDPSVPDAIESNSVFTVVWTDNPTYTVTYSWDKTQTDTKRQGVPLTLKGAIFTRAGYEQDGWSKNPDGSVKDFELGPVGIYSDDADLTLYPTWKELKPVVVDEIARALDCEDSGLTFEVTGGWNVFTNESFAQEGPSCLSNTVNAATLTTTITESGTLTFWWKAPKPATKAPVLSVLTNGKEAIKCELGSKDEEKWRLASLFIDTAQGAVELSFRSLNNAGKYRALDFFTWTPEGGGEPTPGDPVEVTEAGVVDGVFSLTIPTESGDYGVWTNADLTVDSWGLMGEPQKGKGQPMEFKWTILPGFPQLFFRAHKVEYK